MVAGGRRCQYYLRPLAARPGEALGGIMRQSQG